MEDVIPVEEKAVSLLSGMPDPEKVRVLESFALQLPQIDLHTTHVIHGGMCARTVFIEAGAFVTGAQTNFDNICIIWGDITATTDEGPKRLTGFNVIPANSGFKRAVVAHSNTYWTTIYKTDLTDIRAIEDEMTNESDMLQTRRAGIAYQKPAALEE